MAMESYDVEDSATQEENKRLRTQLYEMRSGQIDSILRLVTTHGETLQILMVDVALVKERTEMLSPLNARMDVLEKFQWKAAAIAGAIGSTAAILGWMFPRSHP